MGDLDGRVLTARRSRATCAFLLLGFLALAATRAFAVDAAGPHWVCCYAGGEGGYYFPTLEAAANSRNPSRDTSKPCYVVGTNVQYFNETPSNFYNPYLGCAYRQVNIVAVNCSNNSPWTGPHDAGPWYVKTFLPTAHRRPLSLVDSVPIDAAQQSPDACGPLAEPEPDPGRNAGAPRNMCPVGNPINPATGNKFERQTDFIIDAPSPIRWVRYYNSDPNWRPTRRDLGDRWTHEYQRQIVGGGTSNGSLALLTRPDGRAYLFEAQGINWVYSPTNIPKDFALSIKHKNASTTSLGNDSQGWIVTTEVGAIEEYDLKGYLLSITDSNGKRISFVSNTAGQITHIKDHFDNVRVVLTYNFIGGQITDIKLYSDSTGPWYSYSYITSQTQSGLAQVLLSAVKYPDADDPGNRSNNPYRSYLYAESSYMHDAVIGPQLYPGALTGIADSGQPRFGTYKYDAQGRARSSEHAGGADKVELTFGSFSPTTGVGSTTITDANNETGTIAYDVDHHEARVTGVSGSAAWCTGKPSAQSYNHRGFPVSKTDQNGNKTLFAYLHPSVANQVGVQETCRLEGIPPTSSSNNADKAYRLITTEWNSSYTVPVLVTTYEPINAAMAAPSSCDPNTVSPATVHTPDAAVWRKRQEVQSILVSGSTQISQRKTRSFSGSSQDAPEQITTYTYFTDTSGELLPLLGLIKRIDGPRTDVDDFTDFQYITSSTVNGTTHPKTGDLWKVTRKASASLSITTEITQHDKLGRPLAITENNGSLTTTFTYHPRGWLATKTVAGNQTTYGYYDDGLLKKITAPDSIYFRYVYDSVRRLTDLYSGYVDGSGDHDVDRIHYELDNLGNQIAEWIYTGATKTRSEGRLYDSLSRLTKTTEDAGPITKYTYDANDNIKRTIDPRDPITDTIFTESTYDALNRVRQITDPMGGVTTLTRDVFGQAVSITDPKGSATSASGDFTTTASFNAMGGVKSTTSPDTGTQTFTYDSAGNRVTATDARNVLSTFTYDALNRLVSIHYGTVSNPTSSDVALKYDESAGGQNGIGRLTKVVDETGTTRFY